jgi:hypothetical protein
MATKTHHPSHMLTARRALLWARMHGDTDDFELAARLCDIETPTYLRRQFAHLAINYGWERAFDAFKPELFSACPSGDRWQAEQE